VLLQPAWHGAVMETGAGHRTPPPARPVFVDHSAVDRAAVSMRSPSA
jgi:hypothetical protein